MNINTFTNVLKNTYNVIGVMSGTSLDGIDVIYTTLSFNTTWSYNIHFAETIPYSENWKTILSNLIKNSSEVLQNIDYKYSEYLAHVIKHFIVRHQIANIDFIASHGHTALHQPKKGLTYQIGNQKILADVLQQKVICDFRVQDVKLGGQGAPLVPIGDRLLFSDYTYCINLGGFANISFEHEGERIAFDICPVNIVLNHYISKLGFTYDDKGKTALSGKVNAKLLEVLDKLSFYEKQPPKSLGLEWVASKIFPIIDSYKLPVETILRTFVEHVAFQISKTLTKKNSSVLTTGGGTYNSFLIERIQAYTNSKITIPSSELIEYKEALIFAFLGVLRDRNEVNCLKSVTGALKDHCSGKILVY